MEYHLLPQTTTTAGTTTTTTGASTTTILIRLSTIFFLSMLSIWANHEASKGFEITILNNTTDTDTGRKFDLMFVSNDRASRIVLNASKFVENSLFPDDLYPRKQVDHVKVCLTNQNISNAVSLSQGDHPGEFVIHVSSTVMVGPNADRKLVTAAHRGMARVWLWDGQGAAPSRLMDAMIEYLSNSEGLSPLLSSTNIILCEPVGSMFWVNQDYARIAGCFKYYEGRRHGFIVRLNRAMQGHWNPAMVDEALGSPMSSKVQLSES